MPKQQKTDSISCCSYKYRVVSWQNGGKGQSVDTLKPDECIFSKVCSAARCPDIFSSLGLNTTKRAFP